MTDFCIQIFPAQVRSIDLDRVYAICEEVVAETSLIKWFAFRDRPAYGAEPRHINLLFRTDRPALLWKHLLHRLYRSDEIGRSLQMSSIAMCEGDSGWQDYLLLHHHDPREELHRLEDMHSQSSSRISD